MATRVPRGLLEVSYEAAAQDYLRSLPLEHFMEATSQATQRKITVESLDLVADRRPDVHVFSELLVQYPRPGERVPGRVVPDNMVILSDQPIKVTNSFNVPLQTARPFWVLEYVSKSNKRKDYEENFDRYERDLKVPYYLTFYPDEQELVLHRHNRKKYVTVKPNEHGRLAIPRLDLELALLDGWVRFWYQGELLPLPAELLHELEEARHRAQQAERRVQEAERQAGEASRRAEEEQRRADELQRRLEEAERQLAELRSQAPPRRGNGKRSDRS